MLTPHVFADHEQASRFAADWLALRLREFPESLICLATGATPMRAYSLLAELAVNEPSLVDRCRVIKLDEWGGLPMDDPATCEQHLRTTLIDPLKIADRYIAFESQPANAEQECARMAKWLNDNGPIDLCVLGLGLNGHLGFNEPAEFLLPHVHVAKLSETSLGHAMVANTRTRPTFGLTLGVADLLQSRHILLMVTGARKRGALQRLLTGRVTTEFPASLLTLHGSVQVICDEAAVRCD